MLNKREANVWINGVQHRESTFRKTEPLHCLSDDACDQFRSAGVSGMSFYDDRILRREGGSGITSGNGVGERKVAGTENHYGSKRDQHAPKVRARDRFTIR